MGPADKEEDGCKLWIGRTLSGANSRHAEDGYIINLFVFTFVVAIPRAQL